MVVVGSRGGELGRGLAAEEGVIRGGNRKLRASSCRCGATDFYLAASCISPRSRSIISR